MYWVNTFIHLLMEQIGNSIVEQIHIWHTLIYWANTFIRLSSKYSHIFIYEANSDLVFYLNGENTFILSIHPFVEQIHSSESFMKQINIW